MPAAATTWADDSRYLPLILGLLGAVLAGSLFFTPIPFLVIVGLPVLLYLSMKPYQLLLAMVFLIPFNFAFKVGPVPVAFELLKVFAWIPFLANLSVHKGGGFRTSRYNWYFAAIAGLVLLSFFRSKDLAYTAAQSVRLLSNLGLCYLVLNLVDSREKILQIFRIVVLSCTLVACYGFYQFAIQDFGALFWIVNPRFDTNLAHYRDNFWEWRNRMISVLTSELELGHYFNLCLPISFALWLSEGKRNLTSKWLWMTIAMLAGLVLTFTFGAWLALPAAVVLFSFVTDKKQRWKLLLGTVMALALVALLFVFTPLGATLGDKAVGEGVGSFAWDVLTRLDTWSFAVKTWISNPIIGAGVGNYEFLSAGTDWVLGNASLGTSPHETYLYLLATFGLVGTISVLVVLIGTIRSNLRLSVNSNLRLITLPLAFAIIAVMFGWFSDDAAFLGAHASYLMWLFVGLSEVIRNLSSTEVQVVTPLSTP